MYNGNEVESLMKTISVLDIWQEPAKYRKSRKPDRDRSSIHRYNKSAVHVTVNGRGIVGRMRNETNPDIHLACIAGLVLPDLHPRHPTPVEA